MAEDHYFVREGLMNLLKANGIAVVGSAATAAETLEICFRHRPDVILLDLNLADDGRIDLIDRILSKDSTARLLIYSMRKAIETIEAAYKRGAFGYVTKDKGPSIILEALEELAQGRRYYMAGVADQLAMRNASPNPELDPRQALTKAEYEVFLALAGGTSVSDTAAQLGIHKRTVDNYVLKICKKLRCREMDFAVIGIRYGLLSPTL